MQTGFAFLARSTSPMAHRRILRSAYVMVFLLVHPGIPPIAVILDLLKGLLLVVFSP